MHRNVKLAIAIVLILAAIWYFESQKVDIPDLPVAEIEEVLVEEEVADMEDPEVLANPKAALYPRAPELAGIAGYINTDNSISMESLRGKVVLIDFWTYTCINCVRTLPFLTAWDEKYRDDGLVIIGVHTPEFGFEKKYENVLASVEKHNIKYPVVQDNDYVTWRSYQNRYWPRKYLVDADGFVRYDHIGEGAYEETELKIQELLAEIGNEVDDEVEKEESKIRRGRTPELYAGSKFNLPRGQQLGNEDGLQVGKEFTYTLPEKFPEGNIVLEGTWFSDPDSLIARSDASIFLKYTASEVNIVADSEGPAQVEILIDNVPLSRDEAGFDVEYIDDEAVIKILGPELYNVVDGVHGNHLLEIKVPTGFSFSAFTFG